VTTPEEWINVRRPQILSLFANLLYGYVPRPETPLKTEYKVIETVNDFMDGKATRLKVEIRFQNDAGEDWMTIVVFIPNRAAGPVPAIMHLTHDNPRSSAYDEGGDGRLRNGWPASLILDRGYALVGANISELVNYNEVEFLKSIHRLFFKTGQSFPKAYEWGELSAIGWGAMRALDYLETLDRLPWHPQQGWARRFFKDWFGWVSRSRLQPLITVASMLKRHLDNLLTYLEHRITNAVTEGLNSKIQSLKSAARGFRNFANYRIRILFFFGKLDLHPL
jgi:hypothetical protein